MNPAQLSCSVKLFMVIEIGMQRLQVGGRLECLCVQPTMPQPGMTIGKNFMFGSEPALYGTFDF
jgi:hypothetical protein